MSSISMTRAGRMPLFQAPRSQRNFCSHTRVAGKPSFFARKINSTIASHTCTSTARIGSNSAHISNLQCLRLCSYHSPLNKLFLSTLHLNLRCLRKNKRIPRFNLARSYSAGATLTKPEVESRILDLLKGFEKVKDQSKITPSANFAKDLGLDSLDTVEVVMAIEEEFSIEIPDKDADGILSVEQAVNYILSIPDAH